MCEIDNMECYGHMNEIKTTTQMKFMTQNGINCMNEKNTIWMNLWTWMVLFTLMDLDNMVELDHIARVDDICDINNHNTWMKLTNVDINDMDKTWQCNDTNKVYLMEEICLYGWK